MSRRELSYEEFLLRSRMATPRPGWNKELQALFVDDGTVQLLAKMCLELKEDLKEALAARQMMTDADIRAAIGTQGQISGVEMVLQNIFEAMKEEPSDEMEQSGAAKAP